MPSYPDAVGYLLELRDEINESWFAAISDMAIASNGSEPTREQLDELSEYFHGVSAYRPAASAPLPAAAATTPAPAPEFLEHLTGFTGFKKLAQGLDVHFDRQLTIIFGRNGSGKTSLCEALKVLANAARPSLPLRNVRASYPGPPTFTYRFRGSTAPTTWAEADGFGSLTQALKYFDSTVAMKHLTENLQPGAVVELSVFRTEVFDYARVFLSRFQTYATDIVNSKERELQTMIEATKARLAPSVAVDAPPFAVWTATNSAHLAEYLNRMPAFGEAEAKKVEECVLAIEQHQAAASEEGIKALRVKHGLLEQLASRVTALATMSGKVSLTQLQATLSQAARKRAASIELAERAFPTTENREGRDSLILAAAREYKLAELEAGKDACPLCNQLLTPQATDLFAAYHAYLTSTVKAELAELEESVRTGLQTVNEIGMFQLGDFDACRDLLPTGVFDTISSAVQAVVGAVPAKGKPVESADVSQFERKAELESLVEAIRSAQKALADAITAGTQSREALKEKIATLRAEYASLKAHQAVFEIVDELRTLCDRSADLAPRYVRVHRYDFATRLRAMTNKGKAAHQDLVLSTLEQRLDDEYRALSGATLEQMGVRLASRGEQQDILVTPQIGREPVHRVLSEGEQKVHALAVFMCESAASPNRVLVFDDPATSFDYNYVTNFCERIRNLVRDQPDTQVIVLTHNWDFFMNLQSTVNRSGLNGQMSVQVLEDCATVREYSENWDELCDEIRPIIAGPVEPSADEKERLAGLMRRLIERLTNKHVFNEQRHQYKAKSLQVSAFAQFTKIVPLLDTEADDLRDIYANLSPPEHDDLRNFYTSKSRAQFQTWFDQIHDIKAALEARRP